MQHDLTPISRPNDVASKERNASAAEPMRPIIESEIVVADAGQQPANASLRPAGSGSRRACIVEAAHIYRSRGWPVLRLDGKRALARGWTKTTATDPLPDFESDSNLGILLGAPAGGLVGLDPDWPEMCNIVRSEFADVACPRFGRESAKGCRHLVISKDLRPTSFELSSAMEGDPRLPLKADGKTKLTIGEILSTGQQTMAPPSIHPNGEQLAWESEPAKIPEFEAGDLSWRMAICAVLALATRLWPCHSAAEEICTVALVRLLFQATGDRGWDRERRLQFLTSRVGWVMSGPRISIADVVVGGDGRDEIEEFCRAFEMPSEVATIRRWLNIDTVKRPASNDDPTVLTPQQLGLILSALDPRDYRAGDRWRSLLIASFRGTAGQGKEEFVAWSTSDEDYAGEAENIRRRWDRVPMEREEGITVATLFYELKQAGREDVLHQVRGARSKGLVVSPFDHLGRAREFAGNKRPHVRHYRDDFVDYENGRYPAVADSTIRADMYQFLDGCDKKVRRNDKVITVPFQPCTKSVNETIAALKADRHVLPGTEQPCWLDGRESPEPSELISFPNGILNLKTGELLPPTPTFFTPHAVGFPYDTSAPQATEWLTFLDRIYVGEGDQIEALQEMFGYALSSDVSQEKAFIWVGPKRSGKDTQRNVLQSLLPAGAVCGPTLDSMGTNFGMSQFIGKQLAVVGDMRLGSKCDKDLLAENVLKLTGRGLFTIDRKHKEHWTGQLPCKLLLISNEMPKIKDTSGALASRFIIFNTRESFYGREDPNLFRDKLKPELPGILLWALDGLKRSLERGSLAETQTSKLQRMQLARDGSPVLAFVEECLTLDPSAVTDKDELYNAYIDYAAANKIFAQAKNAFMRELEAATDGKVKAGRKQQGGERTPVVSGIRISSRPGRRHDVGHGSRDDIPF